MEDNVYMTKMATSFLDELTTIEKQGFAPLRFLGSGLKRLGGGMTAKVAPDVAEKGLGMAARFGGKGAVRAGGLGKHIKQIYQAGAQRAGKGGDPRGMLGGLGAVARSRYGQMAGAAAVPMVAGYGLHKMTS